ncbi:hypothetical protein [Oerskovia jenensis]|uniref:hypothetical protein n=1 Tax=Oerskovia jenensis TaxID=162169 RepID=UPI0036D7E97E
MSILTEFFVTSPDRALELASTGPEGTGLPSLPATSIDPVRLSALHEVLTGGTGTTGTHDAEGTTFAETTTEDDVLGDELGPADTDGPWLLPFLPGAVAALAAITDEDLADVAQRWGATEDMEDLGVDPDDLLEITTSLRDLARAARRDGLGLFLWMSL